MASKIAAFVFWHCLIDAVLLFVAVTAVYAFGSSELGMRLAAAGGLVCVPLCASAWVWCLAVS